MIPINKRQIEVEKAKLAAEEKELKELKSIYSKAADDIAKKIRISDGKINMLLKDFDNLDDTQKSILQSQIYQRKFQQQLKTQINGYMSALLAGQYKSIDDYMRNCYTMGFVGAMYDISGQGIPLIIPIDEKQVVKALYTNSKISKKLYTKLGEDVAFLKKRIASTLSRGIATADSYANIARNLASDSNVGFNRAMRIARTEGHRVQANSAFDAQLAAKEAGADIVKQWDATLDGRTRPNHRKLDGQIRELEEPFEVGGMKAMYPSGFGRPEEDVNCRCALMQRARWNLDEDELETLKERAAFFGLDKTDSFNEYAKKYNIALNKMTKLKDIDITEGGKYTKLSISNKNDFANHIEHEFATQKVSAKELNIMWDKRVGYIQNSAGYKDINDYMREMKNKLDDAKRRFTINIMKRVTNNNVLKKDYIGIRKVDASYLENVLGLDISGLFKNDVQRNAFGRPLHVQTPKDASSAKVIADKINGLVGTQNGIINDKAFTSVSLSEKLNYFTHYPIKFEVQMPKGTKGLITDNLPESEFIAKNGSNIEIIGATAYNDGKKECVKIFARMVQK